MSGRPAYDQVIQGLSGIMSVTGAPDTAPLRAGFPVCDSFGGLAAAFAVCAALLRQRATGQGAFLDTSMLDAALTAMGWVASDYLIAGQEPVPMGNENRTAAPSGTFATADGALNIAANKQEQFQELCRVLGRDELITDPRFAAREERKRNRDALRAELERSLAAKTAAEWDEILLGAGVPAAPVVPVTDALACDQVTHRGLVSAVDSPAEAAPVATAPAEAAPVATVPAAFGGGEIRVLGAPTHVDGQPVTPGSRPPRLGEHTEEILGELGYTVSDLARLRAEDAI
jgi:crotonobetainyl-CoA:carnitine CoA-transferase CaiB-like acyl-CoA transferase